MKISFFFGYLRLQATGFFTNILYQCSFLQEQEVSKKEKQQSMVYFVDFIQTGLYLIIYLFAQILRTGY